MRISGPLAPSRKTMSKNHTTLEVQGPKQIQCKQRSVVIIIPMKHWNCTVWIADKLNDSSISQE